MLIAHNVLNQESWDAFVQKYGPRSGRFLQSWSWGEFQKLVGEQVDRISWMSDTNGVNAIAQVMRKTIPHFGTYAYIPRGPIEISSEGELFADVVDVVKDELFVRVESNRLQVTQKPNVSTTFGIKPLQPAHTLITNLSVSTDELLANMHEKTRYNIRLAEKKGVVIEMRTVSIDDVWPVFEATSSRDAFRLHSKEYYRKMVEGGVAFLAIAKHENDILAANIMIDFGDTRTYLHGASSNVKRNFMAPYLLQWALMKDAKSLGITSYDWWGVAPIDAPANHAWTGISRFKRGFGGEDVSSPWAYDVVLKIWSYRFYNMVRKIRRGFR